MEDLMIEEFRICTICGSVMIEGYCIGEGVEYYCSDECLEINYTKEEWKDEYESGESKHTEWGDLNIYDSEHIDTLEEKLKDIEVMDEKINDNFYIWEAETSIVIIREWLLKHREMKQA